MSRLDKVIEEVKEARKGEKRPWIFDDKGKIVNFPSDVEIGNHCWIGLAVLILKGVKMSHGSIVGARSVVTKQFEEPKVIIAGNPALIRKRNIEWQK